MCILSYIPAGIELDRFAEDSLWNGGLSNPDGHGWAIAAGDTMVTGKSLRLDHALSDFIDARDKYPAADALFHSRWATHGSVRVGNCHPFRVGNSPKTVLAHNGVLPRVAHPAAGDDRSDTAILAGELLPRQWRRLDRPTVRKALSEFCGKGNKLVILTVDPRYQRNAYLINESQGHWDSGTGLWHSNWDHIAYVPAARVVGTTQQFAIDVGEPADPTCCLMCDGRVNADDICTVCATCQDCYETARDCLCFVGSSR